MTEILSGPKLVTVFGGSGFVGRHVVRALAKRGYRVRVAVRRPVLAGHLQPAGNVGQIMAMQTNLRVRWSIDRALEDAGHAVNLVGILHETGRQRFSDVQHLGAQAIAEAARASGARMTQMSALGAAIDSDSVYARTKGEGEAAVREFHPDAAIMRPSLIFGPEDGFFNRFATMARYSPVLPLIGGGDNRVQPVYVGDVAELIARDVDGTLKPGQVWELGGPEVLTFRACMEKMLKVIDRKRLFASIPWGVARLQGRVLGMLPNPMLTEDQVKLLQTDNVVSGQAIAEGRTLAGVGIAPKSLDAVLASYLWRYRPAGQFTRGHAA